MITAAPPQAKYSEASSESSRHSGHSFSRTLTTSSTESYSEVVPENLSFEELTNVVESLRLLVRQLDLENQIFQGYLEYRDPSFITDMDETLEAMNAALNKLEQNEHRRNTFDTEESPQEGEILEESEDTMLILEVGDMIIVKHQIPSELARMVNVPSTISIRQTKSASVADSQFQRQRMSSLVKKRAALSFERCPRMNFAQRLDVSHWAAEKQDERLKAAVDRGRSVGGLLRAQIEAIGMRITETRNMVIHFKAKFNESIFTDDKPLSADYFVKDVRGTVVNLDATLERLRLKMEELKFHRKRVLADLAAKRELSESIRPVDIETLKIENEQLTRNIALKTKHLNEVKTVSGHATQKVNSNKKRLAELSKTLKSLRNEVQDKRNFIAHMEHEENPVIQEARKAERALTNIRERIGKFTAPDVLEYVRQKRDMRLLKQQISSLKRTYTLQSQTASELRGRMKYLSHKNSDEYTSLAGHSIKLGTSRRGSYSPYKDTLLTACLERIPMRQNSEVTCPPSLSPPRPNPTV